MTKVEFIVNSRPLTAEILNEANSPKSISPSNLLVFKSNVVMSPPVGFSQPDLYSKKRWQRVQHIAKEFSSRWRKEFLQSLQPRQKWQKWTTISLFQMSVSMSVEPEVNGKNCQYQNWWEEICTCFYTLHC